ncbi:MAG: glycosyltransferase [Oscillospiraceae bacterium]|nr:glycosyltransferase [Oscillospiraceae bacterium]
MKILQVNCVYNKGSTGKLVYSLHQALLQDGQQSVVAYGRGEKTDHHDVHKVSTEAEAKAHSVLSRVTGIEFAYSPLATRRLINLIKRESPDLVHLHCLNGHFLNVYKTMDYLKRHRIPTLLTLHAEIMHTAGCDHSVECERWRTRCYGCDKVGGRIAPHFGDVVSVAFNKMREALSGFSTLTVVGVSDWLTQRAAQSALMKELPCVTVHNGISTDIFKPTEFEDLRKLQGITDEKVILHVTPNFNHAIKGGKYVLELARRMPEYRFIILGYNGAKDILPDNVTGISHTNNQQELAQYYTLSHITLLTSLRETFSMVCAESLCCGTPVVGFKAGAPETICPPEFSEFVEQGNVDMLEQAVRRWMKAPKPDSISQKSSQLFDDKETYKKYSALYRQSIDGNTSSTKG